MKLKAVLMRAFLASAGMGIQGVARFIYTLVIGRLSGPETLSDITALLSLAIFLSLFWPAGLAQAAARFAPETRSSFSTLHRSFWLSSTVLAIIAIPLALWLSEDFLTALCCGVFVFCHNAYVFMRGVLVGQDRLVRSLIGDTIAAVISLTLVVVVVLGNAHWALLLPLAAGYLAFALFGAGRAVGEFADKPEPSKAEILGFTRQATLGAVVTGGLLPATMIFVRAFDTPWNAGMFAAALSLATPLNIAAQALNQVLLPHFSRLRASPIEQRRSHLQIFVLATVAFAIGFGALIVLAPWLLTTFFGARYAEGAAAMQALLVVVFLFSIVAAPSALLLASDRQRVYARVWLIAFVAGTLTMIVAAPAWGQWGAILGFALGGGGGAITITLLALVPSRSATTQSSFASVNTRGDQPR